MACSIDHSKLIGLKFCTECGAVLEKPKRYCAGGHELVRDNKFCEVCGGAEASAAVNNLPPAPVREVPRVTPPPLTPPLTRTPPPQGSQLLPPAPAFGDVPAYVPPAKKNMAVILGASISALILIIGLVVVNANKVTYTDVTVTMNIYDEECWNLGWGYYDIPNGEVVIKVDGAAVAYGNYPRYGTDSTYACSFSTTLYGVPMNGEFYEVSLSSGRRGTVTNTRAEMEENAWEFNLSLGL